MGVYEAIHDRKGQMALLMMIFLATFLDSLDVRIVSVSLVDISTAMGISEVDCSWIVNSYTIAMVGLFILFVKTADGGRLREQILTGMTLFVASSVLTAIVHSLPLMIIFRFIQGVGAAMMGSSIPVMIVRMLPKNRRATGFAMLSVSAGIAILMGPFLSTIATSTVGWELIMFFCIPFAVVGMFLCSKIIPRIPGEDREGIPDRRTTVFTCAFMISTLFLAETVIAGNFGIIVIMAMAAISLTLMFLTWWSYKHTDRPLMDFSMFGNRNYSFSCLVYMISAAVQMGTEYLLSFYLTLSWGLDDITYLSMLSISTVVMIVSSAVAGPWCDRHGCRTLSVISMVLMIVFASLYAIADPSMGIGIIVAIMVVAGVSSGIGCTAMTTAIVNNSNDGNEGEAGATQTVMYYLGSIIGVILYVIGYTFGEGSGEAAEAFLSGFQTASMIGIVISLIGTVLAVVVPNIKPKDEPEKS